MLANEHTGPPTGIITVLPDPDGLNTRAGAGLGTWRVCVLA